MKVKIEIDQNECIGCSYCMNCLPELFKFDEGEFKGKLIQGGQLKTGLETELTAEQFEKLKEAAEGCPAQAIKFTIL